MGFRKRMEGPAALGLLLSLAAAAQAPQGAYQQAARLPARIVSFTAQPALIQAGQSSTLSWSTENPSAAEIQPDIGMVGARGSLQITPAVTTKFTLTVHGPNNQVLTRDLVVTVAGSVPAAATATQGGGKNEIPRMPDGKPNLSGVYNSGFPGTFFQGGPAMNIGGVAQPDETKPALKAGAEKFKVVRGPNDAGPSANCMPPGLPQSYFLPYQWQIVQGLNSVVILYEYPHLFRVIPTHGGPHQPDLDPTWMGDSIGRWEGDTLVVDVAGFNDKTELTGGFRHTEALHIVERFRRTAADTLEYHATIEDPNVFEKPWVVSRKFPLRTDLERVDEFVCENNKDYTGLFAK
ncbi:MAG: hypothetical protein JO307_22400 [Bryobacterales bacterium]|nr:hypothetical protein [Bryobacterales bacterium]MBV9401511.1 hypothetical protein [Bryobacterales bacterium]